jgi:hypothetical protein
MLGSTLASTFLSSVFVNLRHLILSLLCLLGCAALSHAQTAAASKPTVLSAIVVEGDTLPYILMDEVEKIASLPRHLARKRAGFVRLRYNIRKVYPYAVVASDVLKDVDMYLDRIGDDKKARKAYLKTVEKDLNKRFKGELENLSISQGQVLVKLINRQTGKPVFHILKEMKGGFSAVVFQSLALLFNNNLKREYDPTGNDADMERLTRELEAELYYKYQQSRQGAAAQTRR